MPSGDARQVAIVANPYSGSKRNRDLVEALIQELRLLDLLPRPMWEPGELERAAAEPGFTEQYRCVVAAGGDGTLHRVINTTTAVPVAMFPLGTENLFAQHFAAPREPHEMARLVAEGHTTTMDLGRCNDRLFSIVASAGFDADVIHRLHRWRNAKPGKLRRVRRLSYLRPITAAMFGYHHGLFDIEADGQSFQGALCMVFNLPRYGLGFHICPQALHDDGLLDYIVFQKPGRMSLVSVALSVKRGTHLKRFDGVTGRAGNICIRPAQGAVPLELDGEEAGFAPVQITAVPNALRVVCSK